LSTSSNQLKMIRKILVAVIMTLPVLIAQAQKPDMSLFHGMKPRNIGPAGMSGRVTALAVSPLNQDIIYVGTASGGLWKTANAGTTFEPIFDEQPVLSIGAVAVDPNRPDVIWAGTGEGNPRNSLNGGYGIYKSTDGGKTWICMGLQETRHIHRILINPLNSDIIYVGAIGTPWGPSKDRGVFKTVDGGRTWQKILYSNENTGVCDMAMDPHNPDKIVVGMWNHQRWPWYFNSGGPGNGLYITSDGGTTFSQVKQGLPVETGRTGIAFAKSRKDWIYAYVEAKPSAIYRSTDGGYTWEKRGEKGIGNRPFYYAEIYADPKNENRLYTLYSSIGLSEDGGLTFPSVIGQNVHADHHAWWINPENPSHMIEGNDGGLSITYDMGKNWRHITNLPLGQFYHVNTDNEKPYRVYGGLQDNGSWVGPGYAWYNGGLINEFWEFLIGGDGFDAMPVPGDPRTCYAQSQGGNLQRIDLVTGKVKSIKPSNPARTGSQTQGESLPPLRFNWNAALAQDPFDKNTIYFGSQFVHKSINRGDSWDKISPDLTTNDPEKQKQSKSGGITVDATGAENHCTILTIAPSKLQKGLIWAGTDDGNVYFTSDGGETWNSVAQNIKGAPQKAWIPQITASEYNAAEAWVVLNNYRTGDYSAYLYYTNNYGKTWQRVFDNTDVNGFVISFVQDPVEKKLLFAGTENGLYVSFDKGENWNKWSAGYPSVSTYDMVIQPRESDLVIATFGRSIWILDNLAPLRKIAATGGEALNEKAILFSPASASIVSMKNLPGYYYRGDGQYEGDNRDQGASLIFYSNSDKKEKVQFEISGTDGNQVKSFEAEVIKGFNKINWRLDRNPFPMPGQINRNNQQQDQGERPRMFRPMGASVIPGDYLIKAKAGGIESAANITVESDPRDQAPDISAMKSNYARADMNYGKIKEMNGLYQKFYDFGLTVTKVEEYSRKNKAAEEAVKDFHPQLKSSYDKLENKLSLRPEGLFAKISGLRTLTTATAALTEGEEKTVNEAILALEEATKLLSEFNEKEIGAYQKNLAGKMIPLEVVFK
jgi:photosystem II stability/assembly factor-like uncharacterized protein